jgi:hypothetical protein
MSDYKFAAMKNINFGIVARNTANSFDATTVPYMKTTSLFLTAIAKQEL